MPREELDMQDEATAHIAASAVLTPWDDFDEDDEDDDWDNWQIEDVAVEGESGGRPSFSVAAAAITTAAALSEKSGAATKPPALPRVSPDLFKQGMTVIHPEYGPGKIVALSGSDTNRRATIQFATVGQKKIVLAHSPVRPAR
jgi:DNA helicase-2/ATP-dependent DNA helicase PcrA